MEQFPAGLKNAYLFAIFNAFSFQMVLGSPMILYAKTLGASATILGIIAGMMPMLVIFQIPAANYVQKIGYKKFVFGGWGIRVMFIFGMALVPLAGLFLDATTLLALMLMLLFGFNLSRGFSSCAWLPWITALVPPTLRGKYLARDAACVNVASAFTFLLAALGLGTAPQSWQFALLFLFSASMGMASLVFLKRMPDVPVEVSGKTSSEPVPWLAILQHGPFQRILWMNFAWSITYGGMMAFVVAFLKSEAGMNEQNILLVNGLFYLGGLGSFWLAGTRMDHTGSKPVLLSALTIWFVILAGWSLIAGHTLKPAIPLVISLQVGMGLGAVLYNTANTRLAMMTIPPMGRNHFFALFSVVSNLTQGVSPVLWGMMIDAIDVHQVRWQFFELNRYSVFFAAATLVLVMALFFCHRLIEPTAGKMEYLLRDWIKLPVRLWVRLWFRS